VDGRGPYADVEELHCDNNIREVSMKSGGREGEGSWGCWRRSGTSGGAGVLELMVDLVAPGKLEVRVLGSMKPEL
jgi:hypothetical protein